jgi:hypothetical protein
LLLAMTNEVEEGGGAPVIVQISRLCWSWLLWKSSFCPLVSVTDAAPHTDVKTAAVALHLTVAQGACLTTCC